MHHFFQSGLRLGTPAVITRGMKEKEMAKIADWVIEVLNYAKMAAANRKRGTENFY